MIQKQQKPIRTLMILLSLFCFSVKAEEGESISLNVDFPVTCFDENEMEQRYASFLDMPFFYFTFRLLPKCDCGHVGISVSGQSGEAFNAYLTEPGLAETYFFACSAPTPVFISAGITSRLALNTQGESEITNVERRVNVNFSDQLPYYCKTK